ncbi:shikimate kinase AroK [Halomonas halocynthiae]|uniref:shikimate kinase AroK n=1 Tax=Halomonas halocynthiae TaxID=176290 RepID=UPI00040D3904|nr:shikimate kinase AroK [Halomonas halocynthiae]
MTAASNLILVGPMGAGKTTIGRLLAAELSYDFFDTDHEIQRRCGADIPWIFDVEGEEGFRQRETQMICELSARSGAVIATGGGAVLREENRQLLRDGGIVIYLCITVEQQLKRTARDRNRPLLQRPDKEQVLREMYHQRDPLYRATADIIVRSERRGPRSVARNIARQVRNLTAPLKSKA